MPNQGVSRGELESLRQEFQAGLTAAGVQIGAVEKTLKERLSSLKAWGVAALLGGQTVAALIGAYAPHPVAAPVRSTLRTIAALFQ